MTRSLSPGALMEQMSLEELSGYAIADDPETVTEVDVQDLPGPWTECEWGYDGCTGIDRASEMILRRDGWICPSCQATAKAEYEDFIWCARYA